MKRKILILSLSFLLIFMCFGCQKQNDEINLNNYVVYETNGFDGTGTLVVTFDSERLVKENADLLNKKADLSEYDGKTLEEAAIFAIDMYKPFNFKYEESHTLKNDDDVSIEWEINQESLKTVKKLINADFKYKEIKHTVKTLPEIIEMETFNDVYLEMSGMSGDGKINEEQSYAIVNADGAQLIFGLKIQDLKDSGYKNGDVVTVELEVDIDKLREEYGISMKMTTKEITLDGFEHYPTDETTARELINALDVTNVNTAFDTHVKNTIGEGCKTEYVGAALYYKNNLQKSEDSFVWQNQLVFIYKITKGDVEFYQYIMPTRSVIVGYQSDEMLKTNKTVILDNMQEFSTDPSAYSAMKVYEGSNRDLTFVENEIEYAGSKNIKELIGICEQYGITNKSDYYNNKIMTDSLN